MGRKAQILLVISLLLACTQVLAANTVSAGEHQAFWLWSGVKTSDQMRNAQTVYLHQGEVLATPRGTIYQPMGLPVDRLAFKQIWLTVRFTTLDVSEEIPARLIRLMQRWQAAGNNVAGLQIDFDAATRRLEDYGDFLQRLRAQLPAEFALGVTGLLDWAKTGSVKTLNALPVDEIVIQSYQGRKTVSNYAAYLPALTQLRIPFKLGLVQNGVWFAADEKQLQASSWYRGTVIFLLNPQPSTD